MEIREKSIKISNHKINSDFSLAFRSACNMFSIFLAQRTSSQLSHNVHIRCEEKMKNVEENQTDDLLSLRIEQ